METTIITSISEIQMNADEPLKFKGRVEEMMEPLPFRKDDKKHVMYVDIRDSTTKIKCLAFNKVAKDLHSAGIFKVNSVYGIENGRVKRRRKEYNPLGHKYEVVIEEYTIITGEDNEVLFPLSKNIDTKPDNSCTFGGLVKTNDVENIKNTTRNLVLADRDVKVMEPVSTSSSGGNAMDSPTAGPSFTPPTSVQPSDNNSIDLKLQAVSKSEYRDKPDQKDLSGSSSSEEKILEISDTLRNGQATSFSGNVGDVIAIRNVIENNGVKSLSSEDSEATKIVINPLSTSSESSQIKILKEHLGKNLDHSDEELKGIKRRLEELEREEHRLMSKKKKKIEKEMHNIDNDNNNFVDHISKYTQ